MSSFQVVTSIDLFQTKFSPSKETGCGSEWEMGPISSISLDHHDFPIKGHGDGYLP